jgi:hypothetical protein
MQARVQRVRARDRSNLYRRYPGPRAGDSPADVRFANDVADISGQLIGTGRTSAAREKASETPMITMSRTLLARKQSLGSQVIDNTVSSVGWCRLMTRLLAARQDEHTQRGHNMRLGVIKTPLQTTEPCSQANPAVTGSSCAFCLCLASYSLEAKPFMIGLKWLFKTSSAVG